MKLTFKQYNEALPYALESDSYTDSERKILLKGAINAYYDELDAYFSNQSKWVLPYLQHKKSFH